MVASTVSHKDLKEGKEPIDGDLNLVTSDMENLTIGQLVSSGFQAAAAASDASSLARPLSPTLQTKLQRNEEDSRLLVENFKGLDLKCGDKKQKEKTTDVGEPKCRKFQKENDYLDLLPFPRDQIDQEGDQRLENILLNLARSIVAKDIRNGFCSYVKRLLVYIDMYGLRFTRKQHVDLIQLMIHVVTTIDTLPLSVLDPVSELLDILLKNQELLTPDDLCIPWRPLYDTFEHCSKQWEIISWNKKRDVFENIIRLCAPYFPEGSVSEIIATIYPKLCPSSEEQTISILKLLLGFMPSKIHKMETLEEVKKLVSFLLQIQSSWNNGSLSELKLMECMALFANTFPGHFNWDPHLPSMYALVMGGLRLPVNFKPIINGSGESLATCDCQDVASWIIGTLGNNVEALKYFKNFMIPLETYFNPINDGLWTSSLNDLLVNLGRALAWRVVNERYKKEEEGRRWWITTPEDKKLTDSDIDAIVEILRGPPLEFYLHFDDGGKVLKYLALLRPHMIIPAVMEKYQATLESLTEYEKYMTTLSWIRPLIPLMVDAGQGSTYDGRYLIMPLAMSLLPAIDVNDGAKTSCALDCLATILRNITIVDCSSLANKIEDKEKRKICMATAQFPKLVDELLNRIFDLIHNHSFENFRIGDTKGMAEVDTNEISLKGEIHQVIQALAINSSAAIANLAVDKIVHHVATTTLEAEVAGELFLSVCVPFSMDRPEIMLPKLLPMLIKSVQQLCSETKINVQLGDEDNDERLEETLHFHLSILSEILGTHGNELLRFRSEIDGLLDTVLSLKPEKAYTLGISMLQTILSSLTRYYYIEEKLTECDLDDPNYMAFEDWGNRADAKTKIHWHVPSSEELEWAKQLFFRTFDKFSNTIFQKISSTVVQMSSEEASPTLSSVSKTELLKALQLSRRTCNSIFFLLPLWDPIAVEP